jgi:hypothetical protein
VKHPDICQSYDAVWKMLNDSLYSVCSQLDKDFRVIVVCDKQLPLLHHHELINKYTEFIEVKFQSHGKEAIENFNRLGNLSPHLSNPKWWQIQNYHQTFPELNENSYRDTFIKTLKKLMGEKAMYRLREISSRIQVWLKGGKNSKIRLVSDQFTAEDFVLNMGPKLIRAIVAAKKHDAEYVIFFDAGDYMGKNISAYVNSQPGENGWIMAHGYKMAEKRIVPFYGWNSICRSGNIIHYSLLEKFIGSEISEKSTQKELFENIDSEFLITIVLQERIRLFFEKRGQTLLEFPTRSVINRVGHKESLDYARKITRGELVNFYLKKEQKFGEITSVFSTIIDNFNILPRNSMKVFCLGYQKTGTTSVDWVLQDMGYQVAKAYKQSDFEFSRRLEGGNIFEIKQVAELFDAFQDIPWFLYYKEFDQWFPGSKFILTTRDSRSWWRSFLRYFRTENYPLFEFVYGFGNPVGHKEVMIERYERHNQEIIDYFKDRPEDLLVIDVSDEGALQDISEFLNKSSTYKKMPHKNATLRLVEKKRINILKTQLKLLVQLRIGSLVKMFTFSEPPVIIGGSRKSGVELMASILSCHPSIHTIRNLKLNHPVRHPLSPEADRKANHTQPNAKDPYSPLDRKNLFLKLLKNAIPSSAKRWCGASNLSVLAYDRLLEYYGKNVRILNMVRDGRDVVTEYDKKVMEKYVVDGERWVYDVMSGEKSASSPQVFTVRYEDLVHDYENTIRKICKFLGEEDPAPLLNYPKNAKFVQNRYWIGKWQQPQYSARIKYFLQTPGVLEYLQYYGYIN